MIHIYDSENLNDFVAESFNEFTSKPLKKIATLRLAMNHPNSNPTDIAIPTW